MHCKTYEQLQAEEERLQRAWALGIAGRLRLLDASDESAVPA